MIRVWFEHHPMSRRILMNTYSDTGFHFFIACRAK